LKHCQRGFGGEPVGSGGMKCGEGRGTSGFSLRARAETAETAERIEESSTGRKAW
jgi:hypothetical protein